VYTAKESHNALFSVYVPQCFGHTVIPELTTPTPVMVVIAMVMVVVMVVMAVIFMAVVF
jgi:hypothetical protein